MSAWGKGHLLLMGDFDPDEISRELGLQPTMSSRAGELNPATGTPRPGSSWLLTASDFLGSEQGDAADQVISLLGKLEGKEQVFAALARKHGGSMDVFALVDGKKESFFLGENLVLGVGKLNVSFECWFVHKADLERDAAVSA